jgi:hypothetical protein
MLCGCFFSIKILGGAILLRFWRLDMRFVSKHIRNHKKAKWWLTASCSVFYSCPKSLLVVLAGVFLIFVLLLAERSVLGGTPAFFFANLICLIKTKDICHTNKGLIRPSRHRTIEKNLLLLGNGGIFVYLRGWRSPTVKNFIWQT